MKSNKQNKGFTLIEIIITIAISAIILVIVFDAFSNLARTQALDQDYLSIASLIDQAKSSALNSKLASEYGVYFASSTAILFKGNSYSTSTQNQAYVLNNNVSISSINLIGGGANQIVFDRITGYSSASGTITISLKSATTSERIIRIYTTGVAEYK